VARIGTSGGFSEHSTETSGRGRVWTTLGTAGLSRRTLVHVVVS
jgi:hypothetical protein